MNTRWSALGVIVTLFVFVPAFGQPAIDAREEMVAAQPAEMTPSRVLAGLRGYADSVVEALARLAEHPDVLESAAGAVEAGREPALDAVDVDPKVREALNVLARSPGVLLLAASRPDELHLLHSLWSVAPDGVALRLEQLRRAYEEAARTAAHAWQRALESDPVALGEYRDWLTRYCEAAREADAAFACVRVTDRRYYYGCPPDEALILYANEVGLPQSLHLMLARWWDEHAPQYADARVERTRLFGPVAVDPGDFIYDWPAAERTLMWQALEPDAGDHALGLVPAILQPPADQPPTARLAWAVTEHVRLWSPPMPAVALQAPGGEVGPVPDEEEPVVVIEEPIPGPQTARHGETTYVDVSAIERRADVLPRYTGYYYGYPWAAPYYCGPTYYYFRTSVFAPYDVCYPGDPYYLGGVYAPGHLGVRVYGSCRSGRIHYGDGRHYGRVSVSATGRRDRRQPPVYVSTRHRRPLTRTYRSASPQPVLRHRTAHQGRSVTRVQRGGSEARALRPGMGRISTARQQAIGSRTQAIRAGSRPAHSGSSGRAIRPSSGRATRAPAASGRNHGGGVRRR